jgi:hypothetical protein
LYLKTEVKPATRDPKLINARFTYCMVLLVLALMQQDEFEKAQKEKTRGRGHEGEGDEDGDETAETNIEERVAAFTQAVAPVLLPMIDSLGGLEDDEMPTIPNSGDAT